MAGGPNPELSKLVKELELLRIVECPVCTEIPFPPIYMCTAGHNICKSCKPKLKECPTCRGDLTANRNYTVEKIVLASKHSCLYKTDGCKVEETGELIEIHIQKCQYRPCRPFVCPANGWEECDTTLRLANTKDHLLIVHRDRVRQLNGQSVTVNNWVGQQGLNVRGPPLRFMMMANLIDFDGMTFLGQIFSRNRNVSWTVLLIGSEDEARNYKVKITCQSEKERKIQWTVPVQPVCKGVELRKPDNPLKVFIPSCSFSDLKRLAKYNETYLRYEWETTYTIKRNENMN